MNQEIQLGAIVMRDGRLLLLQNAVGGPWELPGGPLPNHARPSARIAARDMG